jgi:hypothetical protein
MPIPMRSLASLLKLRALPGAKRIILFVIALALSLSAHCLVAQEPPVSTPQPSAVVTLGDQSLFTIQTAIGPYTPEAPASSHVSSL